MICDRARWNICENKTFHSYPKLEAELLSVVALLDFSRLIERSDPQIERIAGLEAEVGSKSATVERLLQHFTANSPALVLKQIEMLSSSVTALTAELDKARRTARIAEAQANRDAYAEFQTMIAMLPNMPGDESRYELRAKIAGELRRLIERATAIGNELVIVLKGTRLYRVELFFKRSILKELRLVSIHGGFAYVFPRDEVIGDPDLAGLFAGYVLTEPPHEAA